MTDQMTTSQEAAAFHGLATNQAYPLAERYEIALKALNLYEAEIERLRAWLTEDERRYLAMHARYESDRQQDPRYWLSDPTEREQRRLRWREIADTLHEQPWGPE